jgi:hypothetical protein
LPLPAEREDDYHNDDDEYDCSDADIHGTLLLVALISPFDCQPQLPPAGGPKQPAPARAASAGWSRLGRGQVITLVVDHGRERAVHRLDFVEGERDVGGGEVVRPQRRDSGD